MALTCNEIKIHSESDRDQFKILKGNIPDVVILFE